MAEQNFYYYVENSNRITKEIYQNFTRTEQLTVLEYRPDLLDLFKELHPAMTPEDELHLLVNKLITFEDSVCKKEFSGDDIVCLLHEDVITDSDFERYRYFEKFTSAHWAEILSFVSNPAEWDKYCNFSDFENVDWVKLLIAHPEYANLCPFEILEQEDLDRLLRHQPQLAGISGLNSPVALYLLNSHPLPKDEAPFPFYPKIPQDKHVEEIKIWLSDSFPELTDMELLTLLLHICYEEKTLLGIYNEEYTQNKLRDFNNFFVPSGQFILVVEKS